MLAPTFVQWRERDLGRGMKIDVERETIDRLTAIASAQYSLFTLEQAATIGVSAAMLHAAQRAGWVRPERRGVLVLAGAPPSRWRPVLAAVLAAGPDAVVSHSTAAAMHHFDGVVPDHIELTLPNACHRSLGGVHIHRSTTLRPTDIERRNGVLVTSPIRTLLDVAPRWGEPILGRIIDEGAIARLWTPETIERRIADARRGVAGVADLRRLLSERLGEGNPDSRLEQRVIRLIKRNVPGYTLHHRVVLDGEVIDMDIAWVPQKIDGEVDGLNTRAVSRTKFERTCRRENLLAAHGWRIVHFTAKMDDTTILAQIAPLLS